MFDNEQLTQPEGNLTLESLRTNVILMYKMNYITIDECNSILKRLRGSNRIFGISEDIAKILNLKDVVVYKNDSED